MASGNSVKIKIDGDDSGFQKVIGKVAHSASSVVAGLATGIASVGATLSAAAIAGIAYNATMETYQTNFATMLGSTEKADKLLNDLKTTASSTPLEMTTLAKGTQTLLAFGAATEDTVVETLTMLGDIALGDAGKLEQLSLAFGQMSSTGKLMGQDLNQMINAGFNPLVELSEMGYGTVSQLKDKMAEGRISVEMVTEAFKHATAEGGKFYKAMENSSETFNGQMSNLKDNTSALLGELTNGIFDSLKSNLLPKINGFVKELADAFETGGADKLIETAGKILAEIIDMLANGIPKILDTATSLIDALIDGIEDNLQSMTNGAVKIVKSLAEGIIKLLPQLIDVGLQILLSLAKGLVEQLPTLLPLAVDMLFEIVNGIFDNIDLIIDAGIEVILALADGIINSLPKLIDQVPIIIDKLIQALVDNAPKILSSGIMLFGKLVEGLISIIPNLLEELPKILGSLIKGIEEYFHNFLNLGAEIVVKIWEGIKNGWTELVKNVGTLFDGLFGKNIGMDVNASVSVAKSVSKNLPTPQLTNYNLNPIEKPTQNGGNQQTVRVENVVRFEGTDSDFVSALAPKIMDKSRDLGLV